MELEISAKGINKYFGEKRIFKDINFDVRNGESIAIVGHNGAGKTTLVRILCGLIRQTDGSIRYTVDGKKIERENIYPYIGLVGPYLELYEELTAQENLDFFAKMRNMTNPQARIAELMEKVGLSGREHDEVKTYSSGMRQRLKYVFALLHRPTVLVLDEPTSNLDKEGTATVYQIMQEQKKDKILILATNDEADLKYGDKQIAVNS